MLFQIQSNNLICFLALLVYLLLVAVTFKLCFITDYLLRQLNAKADSPMEPRARNMVSDEIASCNIHIKYDWHRKRCKNDT